MPRGREFQSKVSHQSDAFAPPYHQARVHHGISKKCRCLHQDTRAHTHPRPSTRDARFKDSQADYIPHDALPFPPRNHHSVQVARPPVYKSPYLEIKIWSPYTCLGPHDAKTLGCFVMHVSSMSQVDPPWAAKARILVPLSALVLFRAPEDLFRLRPRSEYVFLAC